MKRLSKKSVKVIKEVTEGRFFENPLSVMGRDGAKMMLRVALEEEITEALGRDFYERSPAAKGYRNGY